MQLRHWLPIVFLCASSLVACSNKTPAEALFDDYLSRLSRITGASTSPLETTLPQYPPRSERRWLIEQETLKVSDYWGLRSCVALFALINERNSILGRVQLPLERLLYEHAFILEAQNCLDSKQGRAFDDALVKKLSEAMQEKQAALGKRLWNASFDSDAFATSFSLASKPIEPGEQAAASVALNNIESWLELANTLTQEAVGSDLQSALITSREQLGNGRFGGRLLRSLVLTTNALNQGTAMLNKQLEQPICPLGKPNKKARVFQNVFGNIYSGRVQPYMSQLQQQGRQWLHALEQLYQHPALSPKPNFASYQQQALSLEAANSLWQQYQLAIRAHVRAWQQQLGQCGLMPR